MKHPKWTGTPANCELCNIELTHYERYVSSTTFACWDHCHSCGQFRGWLCNLCNSRDIRYTEAWANYLAKHDCERAQRDASNVIFQLEAKAFRKERKKIRKALGI